MTQNQIRYQEYLESKRNNMAILDETKRSNIARETENNRHNVATETNQWATLDENRRHNYVSESIGFTQAGEQARHNYATEGIQSYYNTNYLREQARHNEQMEALQGDKQAKDYAASIYSTTLGNITSQANSQRAASASKYAADASNRSAHINAAASRDVANINRESRKETTEAAMWVKLLKMGAGGAPSLRSISLQ